LGLIILLALITKNLSSNVKENLTFDIILSDNIKETEVDLMIKQLKATNFIKSTEYISKEAAAKQLEADIGQNPEDFLGFNPLPGMIVVKINSEYSDPEKFSEVEKHIKRLSPNIRSMEYRKELLDLVNDNFQKLSFILLCLVALLLFISFALINNTIRLMVYSNRFLIHTMKLVGATASFIRKPFIKAQTFTGIIAAVIAIAFLYWGLYYISKDIDEIWKVIDRNSLIFIGGSVFVLGLLISITATFFAVNKYLRMDGDDLFYI
jgi:cell division transport system permease protein